LAQESSPPRLGIVVRMYLAGSALVPSRNLMGSEGKGLSVALATLERTRLGAAAQAVGIAQGATDYANAYAKERIAFDKPINQLQAIQFKLADMETGTAAARELLYRACAMVDRGVPGVSKYTSMAKLFKSDDAMRVTVEAVQVLGGYGYVNEYTLERMMREAKITQIYEGTNEIQRVVIAVAARPLSASAAPGISPRSRT
jgi:alkylation response protein AidB-like acyl-CoA dehydrogenase